MSLSPLRRVLPLWFGSRCFIAFFVYLGHFSHPFQERIEGGYAGVSSPFLNAWTYFDSQHFLTIAREGYNAAITPFFPLYPLLLQPFGPDENRMALAGIVISNLAFLGALWLFYELTRERYGEETAARASWLLSFFPAGAFGMAVYTESLFLLLALGAWRLARQNRWIWAAVLAFLAALTRNSGPFLALALGLEWWAQRGREPRPSKTAFLAVAAPLMAFVAVQFSFSRQFGGAAGVASQGVYARALNWPWIPIWRDLRGILTGTQLEIVTILNLGATLLALWWLWRRRNELPRSEAALLLGVMAMQLTLSRTIPPYTIASLRYVFALWPFTQLMALETEVFTLNRVRKIAAGSIYLLLCAVHSYLFGLKSFLS
ncbi:MAG TPA: mannosyltransferase family protein [Abditibacterium sp.]|jgi:hypothetical protein